MPSRRAHKKEARSISGARGRSRCAARREDAAVVKLFGIEPDGNAPADPQQEFTGKNLAYVARSVRRYRA
jgi:hypothetical protein